MNPEQNDTALAYLEILAKDINSLVKQQEIANLLTLASNPNVPLDIRQQCLKTAMMNMGLSSPSVYISNETTRDCKLRSDYISDETTVSR